MTTEQRVTILGTGIMGRALGLGLIRSGTIAQELICGTVKHTSEAELVRGLVPFPVTAIDAGSVS